MAKAGDAYAAKQKVLKEFEALSSHLSDNPNSFFSKTGDTNLVPKEVLEVKKFVL